MSKNKHDKSGGQHAGGQKQAQHPQAKGKPAPKKGSPTGLIMVAVIAVVVVGIIASSVAGQKGGERDGTKTAAQPAADEAKYLGRLLPANYQAPAVADATTYTSVKEMAELTATLGDAELAVPVADVTNATIVLFKYEKPGTDAIPMIAYVKPSGKLFVGVSYCPPCQGEWQTIQPDGTLTCNACGTKRDLESMVGISGTCKLYPLDEIPATIVGPDIVIERAALDSWTPQPLDRKVG